MLLGLLIGGIVGAVVGFWIGAKSSGNALRLAMSDRVLVGPGIRRLRESLVRDGVTWPSLRESDPSAMIRAVAASIRKVEPVKAMP